MEFYLLLMLGALFGGFVNGLAGFGTALFCLGFFLIILPPIQAVAVIVALSIISGGFGLYSLRHDILPNWQAASWLTVPGLLAVPFGVWALSYASADMMRLAVALLLLLYGSYFGFRGEMPRIKGSFVALDVTVGMIGGFLGGFAALSGALPTMWYAMRDLSKQTVRVILQIYNVTLLSFAGCLLMFTGAFDITTIVNSLIAIPCALCGAQVGLHVFHKLSTNQFQRLLILLTFIAGIFMLGNLLP